MGDYDGLVSQYAMVSQLCSLKGRLILNGAGHQLARFGVLRFKYTTKFSLPKIACSAIVYAKIAVVIDPFFVGVCP